MDIEKKDIELYLSEVKEAVASGRYRLDRNSRRQDNISFFLDYIIDEAKAKEIILGLTAMDFSEILQNEHAGYEHERLYVFGNRGGYYVRERKKGLLYRMQERNRVFFAEEEYRENHKR